MAKKKKPKGLLPSGSFNKLIYVGKRADGSRRYESFTADSPEAAQAEASAFKLRARELRRQGVAVEDIPRDDTPVVEHHGITLGEAMDAFIETCRTQGYSPATIPAYKAVRNNSFPQLINKPSSILGITSKNCSVLHFVLQMSIFCSFWRSGQLPHSSLI